MSLHSFYIVSRKIILPIILVVTIIVLIVMLASYFSLRKSYDDYMKEYNSDTIMESVWDQSILPIGTTIDLSYYLENFQLSNGEALTEEDISEIRIFDGKIGDYYCYSYYPYSGCEDAMWYYAEGTYEITKEEEVNINDCPELWSIDLGSNSVANSYVIATLSLHECKSGLYFNEHRYSSGASPLQRDSLILLDKYNSEPEIREAFGI